MLQVKRISHKDLDTRIRDLILLHCASASVELPDSLLARHYSWTRLAQWLSTEAPEHFMYVMYEDTEPVGLMCFSAVQPIHMDCLCAVEDLLFIRQDKRSLKSLLYLVKQTLQLLRTEFTSQFLVFVGNTLGPSTLPEMYKRIGFSEVGTHLVIELDALKETT